VTPFRICFGARCILVEHLVDVGSAHGPHAPGSIWMSEARSWIAWLLAALTNRTMRSASGALISLVTGTMSAEGLPSSTGGAATTARRSDSWRSAGPGARQTTRETCIRVGASMSNAKTSPAGHGDGDGVTGKVESGTSCRRARGLTSETAVRSMGWAHEFDRPRCVPPSRATRTSVRIPCFSIPRCADHLWLDC
jgi:hypothetical protein